MSKLRVGLIGLGEVAQVVHLPVLQRLSHLYQVVAVHDLSSSVMAKVVQRWRIDRQHASVSALVADQDIDAVLVLSPDQYHREHVERSLQGNKHVFVEKPASLLGSDIEALIAASSTTNRVVMVGYMRRFAPAFEEAKRLLESFGQISFVRVQDFFCEGPWYFRQTSDVAYPKDISQEALAKSKSLRLEMKRKACGEGASDALLQAYDFLTGVSCHSISAMRELLGGPPHRIVGAQISPTGNQLTAMFDYGSYCVTYEYLIDDLARFEAGFDVYSSNKRLLLRYDTPYVRNLPMSIEVQESSKSSNISTSHGPFYKDAFEIELQAFHESVTRGAPVKTSLADSLADFSIFDGIIGCLKSSGRDQAHR